MSAAADVAPARFYGRDLPRPRIFSEGKLNSFRVDPPLAVNEGLMEWAAQASWHMGGINFQSGRKAPARIEYRVARLRKAAEQARRIRKKEKKEAREARRSRLGKRGRPAIWEEDESEEESEAEDAELEDEVAELENMDEEEEEEDAEAAEEEEEEGAEDVQEGVASAPPKSSRSETALQRVTRGRKQAHVAEIRDTRAQASVSKPAVKASSPPASKRQRVASPPQRAQAGADEASPLRAASDPSSVKGPLPLRASRRNGPNVPRSASPKPAKAAALAAAPGRRQTRRMEASPSSENTPHTPLEPEPANAAKGKLAAVLLASPPPVRTGKTRAAVAARLVPAAATLGEESPGEDSLDTSSLKPQKLEAVLEAAAGRSADSGDALAGVSSRLTRSTARSSARGKAAGSSIVGAKGGLASRVKRRLT